MKREQTLRMLLVPLLAVTALSAAGCKKKQDGDATAKTGEGSGAAVVAGSATTGSATTGSATTGSATTGSAATVPAATGTATTGSAATGSAPTPDPTKPAAATKTIVETAKAAGTFTTLVKAIDAAGLTDKLNGAGPFTVFAPTDDAFAKLPAKDLEALLADKAKLAALLQYHVIPGAVSSKDLATQKAIKSVQGGDLAVDTSAGIKIAGATVVTPDIAASNGVIYAIDTVLVPPQ